MTKDEFIARAVLLLAENSTWQVYHESLWKIVTEAATNWISVQEEMPADDGGFSREVLTYNPATGRIRVAQYSYTSHCWYGCGEEVTHWAELPQAPTTMKADVSPIDEQ